ncbi:ImmA/IrrE family metallo-endopeptidase, partial [Stenotrophomonas maltophilia]|uniref:ImmA/IrrE family metallo-endopeptidase n=1 Tax=Stenotrophomonas maltophilia TaxID=40324 RepID=UPI0019533264
PPLPSNSGQSQALRRRGVVLVRQYVVLQFSLQTGTIMTVTWDKPKELGWARVDVSALAADVATKLGFVLGGPIEPIVERMGGQIVYGELAEGDLESGSISIEPGKFTINIPLNTSPQRDRFTIAHELGHFVLHYLLQNNKREADNKITHMRARRFGSDRTEHEANWFAASFLMPSQAFIDIYKELDQDIAKVAERFGVSESAAGVRARSLNLIP